MQGKAEEALAAGLKVSKTTASQGLWCLQEGREKGGHGEHHSPAITARVTCGNFNGKC